MVKVKDARRAPEAEPPGLPAGMVLAALGVGALQALGFGVLAHWAINLIAMILIVVLLQVGWTQGLRLRAVILLGWCFGLTHFSLGLAWLHHSMHHIGGMPFVLSALAVVLFAGYLALFPALAFGLASWILGVHRRADDAHDQDRGQANRNEANDTRAPAGLGNAILTAATLACAWWLTEAARGWLFTGFPWLSVGYGQIDGPLAPVAAIAGVHGVSALTLFIAALAARALWPATLRETRKADRSGQARGLESVLQGRGIKSARVQSQSAVRLKAFALIFTLMLVVHIAPIGPQHWVAPAGAPLSVRLLQGNVAQNLKFEPQRTLQAMKDYLEDFERGNARLTILPETAWTIPWSMTPPELLERVLDRVQSGHHLAVGLPRWRAPSDPAPSPSGPAAKALPANSVMLITPTQAPLLASPPGPQGRMAFEPHQIPIYDKHHLVPFGEFIPWGFGWFVRQMQIPLGDFARGAQLQPPFVVDGQSIAMNICYEDLFGEEIRLPVLRAQATILANVSNLGWFGRSSALDQHLAISRFRSLETGRPMLRSTNTGMTAVIDHQGRVQALLEPHARGALDATIQGMAGLTPYVRWGQGPGLIACALLLACIGGLSHRRRRP